MKIYRFVNDDGESYIVWAENINKAVCLLNANMTFGQSLFTVACGYELDNKERIVKLEN